MRRIVGEPAGRESRPPARAYRPLRRSPGDVSPWCRSANGSASSTRPPLGQLDSHRGTAVPGRRSRDAELRHGIPTPTPDFRIGRQATGVVIADRERGEDVIPHDGRRYPGDQKVPIGDPGLTDVPGTEHSLRAFAPAPGSPVLRQTTRTRGEALDRLPPMISGDGMRDPPVRLGAVAQSELTVVAPTEALAV